ncbi:MAG: hydrogenase nickel incorporation protein HypB [Myxococcales bacterium]|nr:hydrogenase nickel incorporation protein HypB [Myxococcales bacterium]
MCTDCGCGDPDVVPLEVQGRILSDNDERAQHNREHFAAAGVLAVNLMGSPGAGKTAILEATARHQRGLRLAALAGDLATERDAARLEAAGIPARAITTGSACHLDAKMVHHALHALPIAGLDVLFIENVGNLVCPAVYDLGQAANVVALSVTEGEDKPLKYPTMFLKADLVLLTKTDLLPHLDFDLAAVEDALARAMPEPRMIAVSARTGAGVDAWLAWLAERRARLTSAAAPSDGRLHHGHGHVHGPGHDHGHAHARPHDPDHDRHR